MLMRSNLIENTELIFTLECLILVMMEKEHISWFQHQNENLNRDTFLGNFHLLLVDDYC